MSITLYGKKDCGLCAAAEHKFKLMKVKYKKCDIEYYTNLHEGWRTDETLDVLAHHCLINQQIPMIIIDGISYNYTSAMRILKQAMRKH